MEANRSPLKIVIVGHVDHGKSTLVGRILHETKALPDGKVEYLKAVCERRGMPFEWAFVMDALQAERDQGITIDTAQIRFSTDLRPYVIIDAPGHKEFLKNMVSGAAAAEAAVLVVDAQEGVREQSRRHGYLLHLLGLTQVMVAINKMDLVGYDQDRYQQVAAEITDYLGSLGITPAFIVPVSGRQGDCIAAMSAAMPWYQGPTLVEGLDRFTASQPPVGQPLRFPVQDVYKFDARRIVAGRIEAGRLQVGDALVFSPSGKSARVSGIESWPSRDVQSAEAGQSVGITLDEHIFVERGDVAHLASQPPHVVNRFRAHVFWLGRQPLQAGNQYKLKINTGSHQVRVETIERIVDVETLSNHQAAQVERNGVAEVILRSRTPIPLDAFADNQLTGRFVLVDGYDTAGGGVISRDGLAASRAVPRSTNITEVSHTASMQTRWQMNGHKGGVIWLTGLSGAGKSTVAMELERRLVRKGWQAFVLDGDNVRAGLCSDLGFAPDDRRENIRRVGEVAHLLTQAGLIAITAFISPYREDRENVRAMGPEVFHEVFVKAPLSTCEQRDPKGLYRKARAGEIPDFTGIHAPYEEPRAPELIIDTDSMSVDEAADAVFGYVVECFQIKA